MDAERSFEPMKEVYENHREPGIEPNKIMVKKVPLELTDNGFKNVFACFGKIKQVHYSNQENGTKRAWGIVEYFSAAEAQNAMRALQGFRFPGNREPLEIFPCRVRRTTVDDAQSFANQLHRLPSNQSVLCSAATISFTSSHVRASHSQYGFNAQEPMDQLEQAVASSSHIELPMNSAIIPARPQPQTMAGLSVRERRGVRFRSDNCTFGSHALEKFTLFPGQLASVSKNRCAACNGIASHVCPCHRASYCNQSCQLGHWNIHRQVCIAVQQPKATKNAHPGTVIKEEVIDLEPEMLDAHPVMMDGHAVSENVVPGCVPDAKLKNSDNHLQNDSWSSTLLHDYSTTEEDVDRPPIKLEPDGDSSFKMDDHVPFYGRDLETEELPTEAIRTAVTMVEFNDPKRFYIQLVDRTSDIVALQTSLAEFYGHYYPNPLNFYPLIGELIVARSVDGGFYRAVIEDKLGPSNDEQVYRVRLLDSGSVTKISRCDVRPLGLAQKQFLAWKAQCIICGLTGVQPSNGVTFDEEACAAVLAALCKDDNALCFVEPTGIVDGVNGVELYVQDGSNRQWKVSDILMDAELAQRYTSNR